jgi:hypothetical protein
MVPHGVFGVWYLFPMLYTRNKKKIYSGTVQVQRAKIIYYIKYLK